MNKPLPMMFLSFGGASDLGRRLGRVSLRLNGFLAFLVWRGINIGCGVLSGVSFVSGCLATVTTLAGGETGSFLRVER